MPPPVPLVDQSLSCCVQARSTVHISENLRQDLPHRRWTFRTDPDPCLSTMGRGCVIPRRTSIGCHSALKNAIMTDRKTWPPKTIADLKPIIEKYL